MAKISPYFLGVTGGIGSGKSTVCRIFEKLGAGIFYADDVAKKILNNDSRVIQEIKTHFGDDCYDSGGQLHRQILAQKIFGHKDGTKKINAIVHPKVFEAFEAAKQTAREQGVSLFIKEAALIYEAGSQNQLDGVLLVTADKEIRIQRTITRNGWTREEVERRMGHQFSQEKLKGLADYVIDNSGDVEALEMKVHELYLKLKT